MGPRHVQASCTSTPGIVRTHRTRYHLLIYIYLIQVVNVWDLDMYKRRVRLRQALYGHTEPVTCLAASSAYNVIVSGSRDRSCILWDLIRLRFVRQLRGHAAPVAAVCINELTVRYIDVYSQSSSCCIIRI